MQFSTITFVKVASSPSEANPVRLRKYRPPAAEASNSMPFRLIPAPVPFKVISLKKTLVSLGLLDTEARETILLFTVRLLVRFVDSYTPGSRPIRILGEQVSRT